MKLWIALGAVALVGACASGAQMQADCEAAYQYFPDVYRCTADSIAQRSPAIATDPRAKLYLLRGEQLSKQVQDGVLSSLDARVQWQQLFVELKSGRDRDAAAAMESLSRLPPAAPRTAPTNCTSQRSGTTVNTTCW